MEDKQRRGRRPAEGLQTSARSPWVSLLPVLHRYRGKAQRLCSLIAPRA